MNNVKTVFILSWLVLSLVPTIALAEVKVLMKTSMGDLHLVLDDEKAPVTVKNFVDYAEAGFYNNTIFHRVIKGFMIQGGGFNSAMVQKSTNKPIKNEGLNGLKNDYGTIAMARTQAPDSATAQFFINHKNNAFLNALPGKPGYAVFGRLSGGHDVLEKIASVRTGNKRGHQNVPYEAVIIESVSIVKDEKSKVK